MKFLSSIKKFFKKKVAEHPIKDGTIASLIVHDINNLKPTRWDIGHSDRGFRATHPEHRYTLEIINIFEPVLIDRQKLLSTKESEYIAMLWIQKYNEAMQDKEVSDKKRILKKFENRFSTDTGYDVNFTKKTDENTNA